MGQDSRRDNVPPHHETTQVAGGAVLFQTRLQGHVDILQHDFLSLTLHYKIHIFAGSGKIDGQIAVGIDAVAVQFIKNISRQKSALL